MKVLINKRSMDWKYKVRCYHCKSELEVDYKDINREHLGSDYFYTKCIVCGEKIDIKSSQIPGHIREKISTGFPLIVLIIITIGCVLMIFGLLK